MRITTLLAPLLVLAPATVAGQELAARVAAAPADAPVRITYDAKEGLCGDGENILFDRDGDGSHAIYRIRARDRASRPSAAELRQRCDEGPVRVTLERAGHRIIQVDVEVGGEPERVSSLVDLGHITTDDAVAYLLGSVVPDGDEDAARDAIFAATLAAGDEPWPALLRIARDRDLDRDIRRHAVFWVGQAAAERATDGLVDIASADDEDIELRKHALFALSQRRDERSITALLEIARQSDHRELRKAAIFWLGQTDDPRALELFEEILVRQKR